MFMYRSMRSLPRRVLCTSSVEVARHHCDIDESRGKTKQVVQGLTYMHGVNTKIVKKIKGVNKRIFSP